ncbi:hypothetical protein ACFQ1S_04695, partial [Kibdelosporangium lantanae]
MLAGDHHRVVRRQVLGRGHADQAGELHPGHRAQRVEQRLVGRPADQFGEAVVEHEPAHGGNGFFLAVEVVEERPPGHPDADRSLSSTLPTTPHSHIPALPRPR